MHVFDGLLDRADLELVSRCLPAPMSGLRTVPKVVFRLAEDRLNAAVGGRLWKACGPKGSLQDTSAGMHEHRDGSYMGGTHTLLVYLTTPIRGGETRFPDWDGSVEPVAGRAVLFDVNELHSAAPATGRKLVLSVEVLAPP